MLIPSESDLELLLMIVTLTDQNGGRPPSWAELAVAFGLQSSSRGNIQRRLSKLRPTYVDWTRSPRSLHVTPTGLALLGRERESGTFVDLPVPDMLLPLLASGLTWMVANLDQGKPLQAPYPSAWQRGMNILAAECLLRGVSPPTHTSTMVSWCHRSASEWPVRFSERMRFMIDQPLLENEQPTVLCRELAQGLPAGEAELELSERVMGRLRSEAQLRRAQDGYVAVRKFLIEHPVVTSEELLKASFDPSMNTFGGELNDMYEVVPSTVVENGQVLFCGHCGWTLQRKNGRLYCGDDRCRVLTQNFTVGTHHSKPSSTLLRVRRAIRRYIVAPGTYELLAAKEIEQMGLSVTLWPDYDCYDLRIHFPNGQIWAVDVKDWRYPHLLASKLIPLKSGRVAWTKAFYVVPDERVKENPSYLTLLRHVATQQPFEVLTISQLIDAVRREKE